MRASRRPGAPTMSRSGHDTDPAAGTLYLDPGPFHEFLALLAILHRENLRLDRLVTPHQMRPILHLRARSRRPKPRDPSRASLGDGSSARSAGESPLLTLNRSGC